MQRAGGSCQPWTALFTADSLSGAGWPPLKELRPVHVKITTSGSQGRCGKGPWLRFRRWANDHPNDEMDHRAIGSKRRLSSSASANEALQLTSLRGLDGFPGRLTSVKAVGMRVPMAGNKGLGTK